MLVLIKDALDVLIWAGEWSALDVLGKHYGGDVFNYIWDHPDYPWQQTVDTQSTDAILNE